MKLPNHSYAGTPYSSALLAIAFLFIPAILLTFQNFSNAPIATAVIAGCAGLAWFTSNKASELTVLATVSQTPRMR